MVHAGKGVTTIGSYQKSAISSSLIEQLPTDFLAIETCENIEMRQWKKLAINCLINGLTVIFDCKNGDLLGNPKALETMKSLSIEIEKIYQTLNLGLENLNELYQQALQTIALTADNYSSMYQDIHHNRKTEIDYINGYVVRRAQQIGLSCPENERILNAVKQREQSVNERSC